MKTLLLIFSLTVFTFNSLFAQSGWFPLNSGTTAVCVGIFFTDANTGYIALTLDGDGYYLKTTNAGSNWQSYPLAPASQWLRGIFFTDANTGYITTGNPGSLSNGYVYKTTNAGANWTTLTLPVYRHFTNVYFTNANTGYVVGWDYILKTTDAGITWTQTSTGSYLWWSVNFVNSSTGFAAGSNGDGDIGYVLKTTDAGASWQYVLTYNGLGFYGINFIDANTGVAAGGAYWSLGASIFRTTNGGINWNETFTDSNVAHLWSVSFVSQSSGYAVGGIDPRAGDEKGVIIKTTNTGLNWYYQVSNDSNALFGNYFINENTGYVTGWNGKILKTTNGGGVIGIEPLTNEVPSQFQLYQNYPNPFNPTTRIRFALPRSSFATLIVYDILGREIETLVNEQLNTGTYEADWNASNYSSGVYFYKLTAGSAEGGFTDSKKMTIIK